MSILEFYCFFFAFLIDNSGNGRYNTYMRINEQKEIMVAGFPVIVIKRAFRHYVFKTSVHGKQISVEHYSEYGTFVIRKEIEKKKQC